MTSTLYRAHPSSPIRHNLFRGLLQGVFGAVPVSLPPNGSSLYKMATLTLPFLRIVWMITQEKSNVNSFLSYGYSAQRYPDLNIFLRRRGKNHSSQRSRWLSCDPPAPIRLLRNRPSIWLGPALSASCRYPGLGMNPEDKAQRFPRFLPHPGLGASIQSPRFADLGPRWYLSLIHI